MKIMHCLKVVALICSPKMWHWINIMVCRSWTHLETFLRKSELETNSKWHYYQQCCDFWIKVCACYCTCFKISKKNTSDFYIAFKCFKDNMQYLQSNNNGQKLLWKHSWTVELVENEMLVYNKVVHINRTINNVIK